MNQSAFEISLSIDSADAMEQLGARLALSLHRGVCLHLIGPLAAGKTTFARGYVQALGHRGAVKSPTYTLVESYTLDSANVHHFDLYRLADASELEFIGIEEYLDSGADVLVEWPERGSGVLPPPDLGVSLTVAGENRQARLMASTEALFEIISNSFS